MKFAVIGDSYVSRLERYVNSERHQAMKYNYFGIPGMTTTSKFDRALEDLKEFNPRYVLLHVGGNDLKWDSDIYGVFTDIVLCTARILECESVKGIWVCGVCERGKFPSHTGLNRTKFNRQRRQLNNLLRQRFDKQFVDIQKSVKYPRHYETDLVHPKYGVGLKLFADNVVRCFKPYDK